MHSLIDIPSKIVAFILAGGKGKRLYPLTRWRAKSLVPFGGFFRLIDFTISNCINSGLNRISILMRGARIDRGARIRRGITDEGMHIPAGMKIGFDLNLDRARFVVTEGGVVVVHSQHRPRLCNENEGLILTDRMAA